MAATAQDEESRPIYHPSGNRQVVGHVYYGRLDAGEIPDWTLWERFHTVQHPDLPVFGRGFIGTAEDLPKEEVEVVCIALHARHRMYVLVAPASGAWSGRR